MGDVPGWIAYVVPMQVDDHLYPRINNKNTMAPHPEFNNVTTATEAAAAFGAEIRGRTGKFGQNYTHTVLANMTLQSS